VAVLSDSDRVAVERLVDGSVANLQETWDERRGLFPYSARLVDGRVVADYDHPAAVRYTVNSLLGLLRAAGARARPTVADVTEMVAAFDRRHPSLATSADRGLNLLLSVELGDGDRSGRMVAGLRTAPADRSLVMQDVAWSAWGASAAARAEVDGAAELARALADRLLASASPAGLPYHDRRLYRRRILSFGALVYYLRALAEAGSALDDAACRRRFDAGLARALALQGPNGEWPWLLDAASGRVLDCYPLFAVHQDSMAMLFLLPALDRGADVRGPISRSLSWALGQNELRTPMYVDRPVFFAYRSIERTESAPRLRRFARATARLAAGGSSSSRPGNLRVNAECRSYHPGWILFAWSDRVAAAREPQ
jgi:hypothetical protein